MAATPLLTAVVFLGATDAGPLLPALAVAVARVALWSAVLGACASLFGRATRSTLVGVPHLAWNGTAGLAVFAGLLVAMGQIPGVFRPVPLAGLVVALAAVAGWLAWRARGRSRAGERRQGLLVALSALAGVGLVWNRVPAVFFDTLAYHYALPNLWLVEGRMAPEPWSVHSWFPPGMSALYGLGLALGGEAAANDANLLVGLLGLAMVHDLASRLWGAGAGAIALGWFLALPITLHSILIPAADLAQGVFGIGALGALVLARKEGDGAWEARGAWIAAGAVLTKYLGLVVPLALGVLLLLASPAARRGALPRIRLALAFVVPSLVLIAPWLGANALTVGNPVAPVLERFLPTEGLAEDGADAFRRDTRGGLPGVDDLKRLATRLVTGDEQESRLYPTPAWGWLVVVLVPSALLAARADARVRVLLGLAGTAFLLWFVTYRWERFLVTASGLIAAAAAGATVFLWRRGGPSRMLPLAGAAVGALTLAQTTLVALTFTGGLGVALGREAPQAFLARVLPHRSLYQDASRLLDPRRDRVLLVGETRHHGLDVPHAAPSPYNVHPFAQAVAADPGPAQVNTALRGAGFTHLIVDPGLVARIAARYQSLGVFRGREDLLARYLRSLGPPLAERQGVALWRIPG